MISIAILLTCYNRRELTLKCLSSLYNALDLYNRECINPQEKIEGTIYLTDDGCTDGTADAVLNTFPNRNINILNGNGSLYWAGGMRFAWKEALKKHKDWNFYLLLNDDTILKPDLFSELLNTHSFCLSTYKTEGLYSGITCSINDSNKITYGGDVFVNKITGKRKRLGKSDKPQMCDICTANILLVPTVVVDTIGILYDGYVHYAADLDYSHTARKAGFPVLLTTNICGVCDDDHGTDDDRKKMLLSISLKERKAYFKTPLNSNADYNLFIKRSMPLKYPFTLIFRKLNIYFPKLYYWLNSKR